LTIGLILAFTIFLIYSFVSPREIFIESSGYKASLTEENQIEDGESLILYMVGDIMLDRGVEYQIQKEGKGDFKFPFLKISDELNKADLIFGNLESPISDKGTRMGSIYSFRAEPESVEGLKYAGFDIVSLANNHALDYGREALNQTMEILEKNEIDFIGAGFNKEEAFGYKIIEIEDTKIAFLAFTNLGSLSWRPDSGKSGVAWIEAAEEAEEEIEKAKKGADIVIVSFHAGEEYSLEPNSNKKDLSERWLETGADLVAAHHPHVLQPVKKYKKGWIAYSLGNFVFDQSFSEETMKSMILKVKIKDKEIISVDSIDVRINDSFQPYLVE